jgi:hypothetical protein
MSGTGDTPLILDREEFDPLILAARTADEWFDPAK